MASLVAIRRATFKVASLHSSHSIFNRNINIKTLSKPNQRRNDQQQYHATHSLQKHSSSDTQSNKGLKKTPGFSTITLHSKIEYFYNGNYSHDQSAKISIELQNLLEKMKALGYVPNVDEKKQRILTSHSERLAVAYGIINTKKKTPISVFKNLRVCADCHDAMKFISEITQRKITVTDSYQVHHFQNGECSCEDF